MYIVKTSAGFQWSAVRICRTQRPMRFSASFSSPARENDFAVQTNQLFQLFYEGLLQCARQRDIPVSLDSTLVYSLNSTPVSLQLVYVAGG